ncbi:MAG: hypothetical protein KGI50_07505 [Patescibacteria group bacterium]|nr:hypothetical protein [Patescibacteria group bacterium]
MRRLILALAASLALFSSVAIAAPYTFDKVAGRVVSNTCARPRRLLNAQFAGNMFPTADPSPDGTPLTETSATGVSSNVGTVTLGFTNGFTAPITVTAYYWNADPVTPANSCWVRLGASSTAYSTTVDTHYASVSFSIPEYTPFLIRTSAAVTGNVYLDGAIDVKNNNSPSGY